jgi:predicted NUDIX family phosphoesterase
VADVLCVTSRWVEQQIRPGFTPRADFNPVTLLESGECSYQHRNDNRDDPSPDVESDEDYRQVCSYVVIRHGMQILSYGRGKGGGEAQLHSRLSIGVGGHVESSDMAGGFGLEDLFRAATREVREELVITSNVVDFKFVGTIWNADDAVGRRHLGLLFLAYLDGEMVSSREESAILNPSFAIPAHLRAYYPDLERWSQIAIDALTA